MIIERLRAWKRKSPGEPLFASILFYRGGYDFRDKKTYIQEIQDIKAAINEFYEKEEERKKVAVTYIVVTKNLRPSPVWSDADGH